MYLVTAKEMREIDDHVITSIGIPSLVLMENAGSLVAREADRFAREHTVRALTHVNKSDKAFHWAILAGKGNNGGDGLVAARHLVEMGYAVTIIYVIAPEQLTGDAACERDIINRLNIPTMVYGEQAIEWQQFDGIIDALLGTGASGQPRGHYASLIEAANDSGLPIIAVDLPSGLDPDSGAAYKPCIQAVKTVVLALMKRGLMMTEGKQMAGEVVLGGIGIWPTFAGELGVQTFYLNEALFRQQLQIDPHLPRLADTHKGTYGHVLVCAGSRSMSGAGLLTAKAALRAGSGLVTWAVPDSLLDSLIGHLPEVMLAALPGNGHRRQSADALLELMASLDAAVIGPGLGRFSEDTQWLRTLWEESSVPLVLDADALNMLAEADGCQTWRKRTAPVILTPHPGEMGRLLGISTADVQKDRLEHARRFASLHQLTVVLKGAGTVIATPDGEVFVNETGNAGMATGGAGDVLAGVIGSLLAQGLTATQAACLGVWLHGAAGDRAAAQRQKLYSLIAGDIIEHL